MNKAQFFRHLQLTKVRRRIVRGVVFWFFLGLGLSALGKSSEPDKDALYRWALNPELQQSEVQHARMQLERAMASPETILRGNLVMPKAPRANHNKVFHLSLRESILLALRYNPNIQNSEIDRILQRYQLRIKENDFELQYALEGNLSYNHSQIAGGPSASSKSTVIAPRLSYNTPIGGKLNLGLDNQYDGISYTPRLNLEVSQPLLRGAGKTVAEQGLSDQRDTEEINKLKLKSSIINQVTTVIENYRRLILQNNALQTARTSLKDAQETLRNNQLKIKAGQLEPTANVQQSYQVESLKLALNQSINQVALAKQSLLQAIGLDPKMEIEVPNDVQIERLEVPVLEETLQYALQHNLDFLATLISYQIDKRALLVAKNQQLWKLDVIGNATLGLATDTQGSTSSVENLLNGRNASQSIGLKLSVPINDLSRRQKLIQAKLALEKDKINIAAQKRDLINTIINVLVNIQSQVEQIKLARRQVKLAKESYQLEKKKQAAGIASALDISNTQNQLINAQNVLISAKIGYLNQITQLQKILATTNDVWKLKVRY